MIHNSLDQINQLYIVQCLYKRFLIMIHKHQEKAKQLKACLKQYQNFPKPGLKFYDIFPLIASPKHLDMAIDIFVQHLNQTKLQFSKIFMLESRGFLFAVPLSLKLNKPCYPFRKKGKLPGEVYTHTYDLEYGSDSIQIQIQSIQKGDRVIIVDDLLATGGTLNAAIKLLESKGAIVQKCLLLSKIVDLKGDEKLGLEKQKVFSIIDL